MYFNVLAARVYMKQLRMMDGRGVLFAVADDVKIQGPPEVIQYMDRCRREPQFVACPAFSDRC